MSPSSAAAIDQNVVAEIFATITRAVASLNVTYEGPDRDGSLQFRMAPGTPLLTQSQAVQRAREIYDAIRKVPTQSVRDFVDNVPSFKILPPR
ncbi:MAG TPA: hypothetical protein VGG22_07790 [Candidatus Baltobacteraceae bacterium]|jgi:hypothetical protein